VTVTDERPQVDEEVPAAPTVQPRASSGVAGVVGTADHKTVGRLYIALSVLFMLLAGVLGGLVGAERVDTAGIDVLTNAFDQVYSLHAITGVFLFLLPLILGIALVVVPLQVGASTVAFPRAAAASFWLWVVSSGILLAAYGINGGVGGGDAEGVDLFLLSFAGVVIALLIATLCVVCTVVALRTNGMTLDRTPMFSWSMLVAGTVWMLSLPVVVGTTALLYIDHRYGRVLFGGSSGIFVRMLWVFVQPQVYAFAVPALGFLADVVPVASRTRSRVRPATMTLIALVGALGFGAWTQVIIASDGTVLNGDATDQVLYVIMAFAVVIPILAVAATMVDVARSGSVRFNGPLVLAISSLVLLVAGATAGAVGSIQALDLRNPDTTWVSGQSHLVLLAAGLGALGSVHYWAPKLLGRMLADGTAIAAGVLILLGGLLLGGADLAAGVMDQPLAFTSGSVRDGVEALNGVALGGGILAVLGALLFIGNALGALLRRSHEIPDDPWEGQTLEWATASPPVFHNFAEPMSVTSAEPLLDLAAANAATDGGEA
jgi:heme/copper-type cytochrome/quinol oxidase subunit 1